MSDKIRIVFDDGPGPVGGTFIEVEDERGHSLSFGEWKQEGGLWYLEFDNPASLQAEMERLKNYVQHKNYCAVRKTNKDEFPPCDCGLTAILSKEPDET